MFLMEPQSARIRKGRAPQRPPPDPCQTPSALRRRSSRLQSRQRPVSTSHTLGSYYESQSPLEQRQTNPQTLQPPRATSHTRVPNLDPVKASPPVPSRERFQGYLGPPQTINQPTQKPARLTKKNLEAFEKMGRRTKKNPRSKSPQPEENSSSSLPESSAIIASTSKTVSTANSSFRRLAFKNGILNPNCSIPHENLSSHQDQLDRVRNTPSPSESEFKEFSYRIRRAPNEMTMVVEISKLLQSHGRGYGSVYNQAFNDFPRNVGFNDGLSATQPDIMEGLEIMEFDPFPVNRELGGAAVPTLDSESLTLSHLAGEFKGPGKDMRLAETQAAYDGACMVYGRNKARSFLNKPDPAGYAYVRTFTTDGTTLNTYAHYSSTSNGQVRYHQCPTSLSSFISSYKDFKTTRRRLRNLQDDAKESSEMLRDELNKNWLTNHQSPSVVAETANSGYEDRKNPTSQMLVEHLTSFPTENQYEQSPAADTVHAPPYAPFPPNNEDSPFIQVPTASPSAPSSPALRGRSKSRDLGEKRRCHDTHTEISSKMHHSTNFGNTCDTDGEDPRPAKRQKPC